MDELKEIERQLDVLQSLVSHNGDLSQQRAVVLVCEDIEGRLDTVTALLSEKLETDRIGAFHRHLWFISRFPRMAQGDLVEILHYDYPTIRDALLERIKGMTFVHPALFRACHSLLRQRQYTSAIREAFVAWKEHSCMLFRLSSTVDGHALIDRLFSSDGLARGKRANDIETAFLGYCKASFTFFRNKLSHNIYQATPYEADAALTFVSLMLYRIDSHAPAHPEARPRALESPPSESQR